jgi:hypothetical protein
MDGPVSLQSEGLRWSKRMRQQKGAGVLFIVATAASLVAAFSWLLYRSNLVPRWLSGWGIAGLFLMMAACLLAVFNQRPVTSYVILALPIGLQEMVLALWLIVNGFSSAALESVQTQVTGAWSRNTILSVSEAHP